MRIVIRSWGPHRADGGSGDPAAGQQFRGHRRGPAVRRGPGDGRGRQPPARRAPRLERGPAYGETPDPAQVSARDWPTYRHDPARSGHTDTAVPSKLERMWAADLGGTLSSPIIAAGKVFVSSVEDHTVHALDTDNGEPVWSYTAGGRVDSPPTIYKGLVLFGSADGWVYCLHASDGRLVWRFRAAPDDRRIVAYGQLESKWPVHGSILVQDDSAYFVAGRCSFLDDGMYLYRLDPQTGKTLSETHVSDRDPKTGEEPQEIVKRVAMSGALPDVLSSDGESVYMRHKRFGLNGAILESDVAHLYSPAGFLDGSWWHRTYWMVGAAMKSGYGGWPQVGNTVPAGRLLTFDDDAICGFARSRYAHHGSHVGLDASTIFHYKPKRDAGTRWTGYHLFGMSRSTAAAGPAPAQPPRKPGAKRVSRPRTGAPKACLWSKQVPLLVRGMVSARKTLFVAGPPAPVQEKGAAKNVESGQGGLLLAVSATNGEELAKYKLDSPPAFDGMAAATGRLYLSTESGQVVCFAREAH